jgi:hypothetical protein
MDAAPSRGAFSRDRPIDGLELAMNGEILRFATVASHVTGCFDAVDVR